MQIFPKNSRPPSLFSLLCEADSVSSLISAGEKIDVAQECPGDGVNIIDCRHPFKGDFIREVDGLDLANKLIVGESIRVRQDIPIIPPECFDMRPEEIESVLVGVRLRDVLDKRLRTPDGYLALGDGVQLDFSVLNRPVFRGKRTVLVCTDVDVLIEKLWWLRHSLGLFDKIAEAGFYAVIGMNFSSFIGECPFGQLINMNKSLCFCQELGKRGVTVLPHVYAVNDSQRQKLTSYLRANPNIQTITINTQMQRDAYSKYQTYLTIQSLMNETSVNVLLVGRRIAMDLDAARIFRAEQSVLKTAAMIRKHFPKTLQFTIKTDPLDTDADLAPDRQTVLNLPL